MPDSTDAPKVIFTDDGWILSATEPPLTSAALREQVVESHAYPGAALGWSIGDHEVYQYETEIGEIVGSAVEGLDETTYSFVHDNTPRVIDRIHRNIRALMDESGGPLTTLAALSREAGLPFFPRVRMNSHYEIDPQHPAYGSFRRDHPEFLIGRPGEDLDEGSLHWGQRTGKDYAVPQVREYMASIIFETFERFDVDGVELDFMRHPGWFRPAEAYQNRYLMTDLVERTRRRLDEVGKSRGRRLRLIVRVPPTLADSLRTGLDVEAWIRGGLVDIVAAGGGMIPFETPVSEFVDAARGTDCLIYGCIEATRHVDDESIRALAARWLGQGAAGLYLYNFYTIYPEWNGRIAAEVADPRLLARADKRYELDRAGPPYPTRGHGGAFRYASPPTSLPVALRPTTSGEGARFSIEVADDLKGAVADDALGECSLTLRFERLHPDDEIEALVNGASAGRMRGREATQKWTRLGITSQFWMEYPSYPVERENEGASLTFPVACPPLRNGVNEFEVRLTAADVGRAATLTHMELDVVYRA